MFYELSKAKEKYIWSNQHVLHPWVQSYEIRIPADQGIAGHVATMGKILNIKDAYSHPLFYRGVDDSTGFRTRNILCFPIKDENQEVIGVAELVNKINGPWFSKFDEDLATAFSIYCGISIAHAILSMLQDMNFISSYKIDRQTLVRFCLMKSVLAALYSSEGSVMERHHFAQAIAILNTHGCNIFDHFSRKDYQRMLDLMRDIILATDLAHHLRIFKDLQKMADVGYDPANKQHHSLLLCLLMTSCDLSDQTKGWKTTRKIAEKAMGNRPMEMMDREKAYIPELQISFMEHIAMPIYKRQQTLSGCFRSSSPRRGSCTSGVASNREHWTKVSHKFTLRGLPSNNSLDFLDEEYDLQAMAEKDGGLKMNGCLDGEDGHGDPELE
ncbi:hypothetical protein Chor_010447 [Crotalus horridus]